MNKGIFRLSKPWLAVIFIFPMLLIGSKSDIKGYIPFVFQITYIVSLIMVINIDSKIVFVKKIIFIEGIIFILGLMILPFQDKLNISESFLSSWLADISSILLFLIAFDFIIRVLKTIHPGYKYKGLGAQLFSIACTMLFLSGIFYVKGLLEKNEKVKNLETP